MQQSKPVIIGITGAFGSGKSTAADYFEKKGFVSITLSSFLEEEATRRNLVPITRKNLQDIGNEWRETYGKGILAQRALEKAESDLSQRYVVDGLRNTGEIEVFRENANFQLVAIVSDRKNRFERLQKVKRREEMTWELFETLDARDLGTESSGNGLQVASCIALADIFIENNTTEELFKKRLDVLLV
ncbi:MAG TPA: AAA family ATPase [Candidatus Saccharimonadales bacterium]|nr:AAA family ATPase [Candidatus Saccharimonadales bacterium]